MALPRHMQVAGIVLILALVAWLVMRRTPASTQTADMVNISDAADSMLVIRMHNQAGSGSMFQLGINGRIVLARRDPTSVGKTYRVPIAKYGGIANISIVVFGTDITVDEVTLRGKDILTDFVYSGSDLQVVTNTTRPAGQRVHSGAWNRSGVYVYVP